MDKPKIHSLNAGCRDSVVVTVTEGGQWFEHLCGQEISFFFKRAGPALGPTQPSTQSKPEVSNRG